MSIKKRLNQRLAATPNPFLTRLLLSRVSAHNLNGRQTIVLEDYPSDVLAIVPDLGSVDVERILAANIAYAMNVERGML